MTYSVHYAKSIYETQVESLSATERAEIDAHVKRLGRDPFPGSGVFRVRVSGALHGLSSQPLYAARTRHFVVYHNVERDRVVILGLFSVKLEP